MSRKRTYCCVFGCLNSNSSNPELSFFMIPTEQERRLQWLQLISREDLPSKASAHRVCEVHFNAQDICVRSVRKVLKKNCLPCLHLPNLFKEDKQIQTDITKVDTTSQTEISNILKNISQIDLSTSSCSCQTEIANSSDNISQTAPSLSADTPRKRKLKSEMLDCKKRLRVHETEQTSPKSQQDMFHKLCDRFLSNDLAELVKAQTYLKSSHKGNRYTLAYKMFCLNLYYVSPQAYRLLQKSICLPCKTTLNKLYIPMSTQVNDDLMAALKLKVNNMSDREKQCTLVVDAMSLKTNLYYDIKNDKIIGFHEVDGVQSPSPAKHALVVLIRGMFVKWSQAIGFALLSECKSDDNISKWIDKIILKLFEIGLKIRVFVSDLGSDLLNAAKKRGISIEKTYFTVNDHKIYYIFDAPHLIKLVRNNLMTYDFHFQNGAVAKFEHIVKFYEHDKKKTFKQAYKLTNSHIYPTNFERMKVRYATQLLSRSVASGLSTCIDFNVIDESARHTVELVKMMNDLFDALNSSTFRHSYLHKSAFCGNKDQIDFFNNMLIFFQTINLRNPKNGNDVTKTVKFIQGFQITIQSILHLYEDLKQEGYQYLLTRRLNQDIIENFFGKIRSKNGMATEPTSRQFISAFRKIYFANITQAPKEGNCAEDLTEFLVHLNNYKTLEIDNGPAIDNNVSQNNVLREIVRSDYGQLDLPEKNAFFYVCGALLKKCADHHNDCALLKLYMDADQRACNLSTESRYLNYRNYGTDRNLLVVPPDDFVFNIERMEEVFYKAFEKDHINSNYLSYGTEDGLLLYLYYVAAQYSGADLKVAPNFVFGETNKSEGFLKKFPAGKVPAFESADGKVLLTESNAIAYYVANEQLRGKDLATQARVWQWASWADSELLPASCAWVFPYLGIMPFNKLNVERAKADLLGALGVLDAHLRARTFLVGERVTLADVAVAATLLHAFAHALEPAARAALPHLTRWFLTLAHQPPVRAVLGPLTLCAAPPVYDPKKYHELNQAKPKEGAKKDKKAEKKEQPKKKEPEPDQELDELDEKPKESKDPFDSMPKGTFNMDDFKRCYSNEDEAKSIPYFWQKFDPENYSIWYAEYKYPEELAKVFMSCNLITGMYQRLDKMRKQAFASVCLFGEDNNSSISGVWVWRGQELAFPLSPDWQIDYESYEWKKLDPASEETKKLVHDYFSWTGTDKQGRKFNQGKIFK